MLFNGIFFAVFNSCDSVLFEYLGRRPDTLQMSFFVIRVHVIDAGFRIIIISIIYCKCLVLMYIDCQEECVSSLILLFWHSVFESYFIKGLQVFFWLKQELIPQLDIAMV